MLNIYDINYELCYERLGILNLSPENLPKKGILVRILSLIKGFLKNLLTIKSEGVIKNNSTLFFVMSENEFLSVKDVANNISSSYIFGIDRYKNGYPITKIYFFSLFFIPIVIYQWLICNNSYYRKSFPYAFDGFCLAYSSNFILKKYLKKLKPNKIIIANQLSFFHRSLALASKELKIETFYIQHASITENFSDLNVYSNVLLEGEDSLHKVQNNGTKKTRIFLIGMPKFDKYFSNIKKVSKINKIGICTNGLDNIEVYETLIKKLSENFLDLIIFIRPHPADRRKNDWYKLSSKYNTQYSDVLSIESFTFFKDVDLIISGNSNIHLEATLLNLPTIYFDSTKSNFDWYGFIERKLVFNAEDEAAVINYINYLKTTSINSRQKAKYYIDTVDSLYDGKSTLLASKIINEEVSSINFKIESDDFGNKIFRL